MSFRRPAAIGRATRLEAGPHAVLCAAMSLILGCGGSSPAIHREFTKPPPPPAPFTAGEALKQFDTAPDQEYRLGEGDVITIQVWDRLELSGSQIVGPDGAITVPVAGTLHVAGMTREDATKAVKEALVKYYAKVTVTVRVDRYVSNRVVVLGQVRAPGVMQFETMPTLLEALARAGGVTTQPTSNLTHCAIVRGRDRVAWIDLRGLLQDANLALNLRLRANDLVFIPDRGDLPIYVLGEVYKPGLVRWTANLTLLEALAQAGGATRDAASSLQVISPSRGLRTTVVLKELQSGVKGHNVTLQGGDIVYVTTSGLADIGYVFEKLNPFGWVFLGATVRSSIVR
jgi:polysaccharide export outer membrane protein